MYKKIIGALAVLSAIGSAVAGCCHTKSGTDIAASWVGTWSTALQLVEPHNMPPEPGLSYNTLRQVVRVSIGGEQLRLHLSNEYGNAPLLVSAARIAASAGMDAVDAETARAVLFDGKESIVIEVGSYVTSDPLAYDLRPGSELAITPHFGEVPSDLTGHPGSRTTSFIVTGNDIEAPQMPDAIHTDHWYVISGIDVASRPDAAAVVTLGDSITDGRGSGTNRQNRWPDRLAGRMRDSGELGHVAVLNKGIGGNCVLKPCLGPSALARFERDVLAEAGVRWLIVLHGVNDIGGSQEADADGVVDRLTKAYATMIDRAHEKGIKVFGATILPFGGSFYDSPCHEEVRQSVNSWIRTSGRFDAVIDLDAALRDPESPNRLLAGADTGDHLHPSERGHELIAEAVDLRLFSGK